MKNKEHLTLQGIKEIVDIKASGLRPLNLGLSSTLKEAFPYSIPVTRPIVKDKNIPDPYWVAGFTSGEGCFYIAISKSNSQAALFNVRLRFILSQHARDEHILRSFTTYLNCGNCEKAKDGMVYFKVTKFSDNYEKILTFFSLYKLHGVKATDFKDWCVVAELIKTKAHLTRLGLQRILNIKQNMNKGRI